MISKLPKTMHPRPTKEYIRTAKGIAISLLLHLFILLLIWAFAYKFISIPAPKSDKKITLDLSNFVKPQPTPKPQARPQPLPTPAQKPEPKKKILQPKKIYRAQKSTIENNITKSSQKLNKIVLKKPTPKKKKRAITKPTRVPRPYNSSLANSLMSTKKAQKAYSKPKRSSPSPAARRMINKLYGSEFDGYSKEQKKFIEDNLIIIHRITQLTLDRNGYPDIAARTGQEGTNIVSFYLHPNGDITSLRLDREMGYEALDNNTLQVIRVAYKDYPLPRQKTKIKFFVKYSISGY